MQQAEKKESYSWGCVFLAFVFGAAIGGALTYGYFAPHIEHNEEIGQTPPQAPCYNCGVKVVKERCSNFDVYHSEKMQLICDFYHSSSSAVSANGSIYSVQLNDFVCERYSWGMNTNYHNVTAYPVSAVVLKQVRARNDIVGQNFMMPQEMIFWQYPDVLLALNSTFMRQFAENFNDTATIGFTIGLEYFENEQVCTPMEGT
jgi:hypothetical protein